VRKGDFFFLIAVDSHFSSTSRDHGRDNRCIDRSSDWIGADPCRQRWRKYFSASTSRSLLSRGIRGGYRDVFSRSRELSFRRSMNSQAMILLRPQAPTTTIPGDAREAAARRAIKVLRANRISAMTQHVSQSILIKSALCYRRRAANDPNCFAVRRQCDHRLYHLPV